MFRELLLLFISLLCFLRLTAQEGGPPMLVDDAEVADYREWEINTSLNLTVDDKYHLAIPHLDINYGIWPDVQLTVGIPYLLTFNLPGVAQSAGEANVGIKYLFLKEGRYYISAGTFPQIFIDDGMGLFIPLFLQRTFNKVLLGWGVSYFIEEKRKDNFQMGLIVGYKPSQKIEFMLEYMAHTDYAHINNKMVTQGDIGHLNMGFRYFFTDATILMGSFGTQVYNGVGKQREYFIGWLGIRSLF